MEEHLPNHSGAAMLAVVAGLVFATRHLVGAILTSTELSPFAKSLPPMTAPTER